MSEQYQDLIVSEINTDFGKLGQIVLNKPKALNAISTVMIEGMQQALDKWRDDDTIKAVWIEGSGDKAFCAGGDVVMLYHSMKSTPAGEIPEKAAEFFAKEYRMDETIHTYPKPVIVWGDGIVMGGGIGVMAGASHRIVTERSMLAMPEVTIGLYPDVGASWFLNRMPGQCGEFLGMTGARMNAADALFVKLADFAVSSSDYESLRTAISQTDGSHDAITSVIQQHHSNTGQQDSTLYSHLDRINALMAPTDMTELVAGFAKLDEADGWLYKSTKGLLRGCPMTLYLVREQIKRAKYMSLSEIFAMELIMSIQCVLHPDLAEGVRALLIDKDNKPQWSVGSVAEITPVMVDEFFQQPQH
ncbi:enoyl-CoA hydratase/isomerase family protein [Marinicella gelatinilytica]|uniref:enoyl-CoA hydratase/isomerase family protein n=1 Tax=Marinicella gelatinilytica TaxID=2996017 RepID=UPI002260F557|nr:enoyl-CoA hydratase/isomerase family protein [Marinicella gelatinilytica]MCX7546062.1 enoyl-CoA hydratase/isomerase family protein [Marinicella gelatinilytica]